MVRPGEDATILCTATGDAPIQIQWAKLGQPYLPRSVIARGGRLEFRGISSEDQGRYTCTARNQVGTMDATAEVVVSSKFIFTIDQLRIYRQSLEILGVTVGNRGEE